MDKDDTCAICLAPLSEAMICTMTCRHMFHAVCLTDLHGKNPNDFKCPLCREIPTTLTFPFGGNYNFPAEEQICLEPIKKIFPDVQNLDIREGVSLKICKDRKILSDSELSFSLGVDGTLRVGKKDKEPTGMIPKPKVIHYIGEGSRISTIKCSQLSDLEVVPTELMNPHGLVVTVSGKVITPAGAHINRCSISAFGTGVAIFEKSTFKNVSVTLTGNARSSFYNSTTEELSADVTGPGFVENLNVTRYACVSIVGQGKVNLITDKNVIVERSKI